MSIYLRPSQCADLQLTATLPTEKIQLTRIYPSDERFDALMMLCQLSKNLYNATLFQVRQQFFENQTFLNYAILTKRFAKENQADFPGKSCAADDEIGRSKLPQFLWFTPLD